MADAQIALHPDPHEVLTVEALEALYGETSEAARLKETPRLTQGYRRLIEASPFCVLATSGPEGLDCSPRGDAPGFVTALDEATLALPDRRGNNRLDSLRNILRDPRVALLFLIPGLGETLRVNGRARITADPGLRARFAVDGKEPATVVLVAIETVYFQCAKSLVRSGLWKPETWPERAPLPTPGRLLAETREGFDAGAYDAALPARLAATLY